MEHYQHGSHEGWFYIWQAWRTGSTQQHIAKAHGRHPSTICRDLKRNTYARCHMYTYYRARQIMQARQVCANWQKSRKLTDDLAPVITQLIRHYLSPEQANGYLK